MRAALSRPAVLALPVSGKGAEVKATFRLVFVRVGTLLCVVRGLA